MHQRRIHSEVKELLLHLSNWFTVNELAFYTNFSRSSLYRILKVYETTGEVELNGEGLPENCKPTVLTGKMTLYIERLLERLPDLMQFEIQERVFEKFGVLVSRSTICRVIKKQGMTYKKLSKRAIERNEDKRAAFILHMGDDRYSPEMFIFMDESCVDIRTTFRNRGYATKGRRAVSRANFVRGKSYSVLPAISLDGVLDVIVVEGSITGDVLEEFVEGLLEMSNPFPGPNSVLVMDNASIHRCEGVRELCRDRGVRLVYLPAYSLDFNPIEEGFSAMKAWLRRYGTHVREKLRNRRLRSAQQILTQAVLAAMTPEKIQGWYYHSGYL